MNDLINRDEAIRLISSYPGPVDKSVVRRFLTQMEPEQPIDGSITVRTGENDTDRPTDGCIDGDLQPTCNQLATDAIIRCRDCKRNADNGGLYPDGRTRCPIQEHYSLLQDGYCHLGERREE